MREGVSNPYIHVSTESRHGLFQLIPNFVLAGVCLFVCRRCLVLPDLWPPNRPPGNKNTMTLDIDGNPYFGLPSTLPSSHVSTAEGAYKGPKEPDSAVWGWGR